MILEDAIAEMSGDEAPRVAVIDSLNTDGTVNLQYLNGIANNVPVLVSGYVPSSGHVVQVMRRGTASLLVLGQVRSTNATTTTSRYDLVLTYNVDAAPAGGLTGASGTATFLPAETRSYRTGTGWNADDFVGQGAYETRFGYYQGCMFYGVDAFKPLVARTITRVRLDLSRLTGSGVFAAEPIHLWMLHNTTRPAGAPFLGADVGVIGSLAVGASGTFDLPVWVGEHLRDGNGFGLAVRDDSTGNYLRLAGKSAFANSGRLTIDWKE